MQKQFTNPGLSNSPFQVSFTPARVLEFQAFPHNTIIRDQQRRSLNDDETPMSLNWRSRFANWTRFLLESSPRQAKRRSQTRQSTHAGIVEVLESRQLLTSVVAVHVDGNSISLNDFGRGRLSDSDNITVAYTNSQVVLSSDNGTSFRVGNQTLSTYTINITAAPSLHINLMGRNSTVNITGPTNSESTSNTGSLASVDVNFRNGRRGDSALNLTNVKVNSMTVNGGRGDDVVTLTNSTVNQNLQANLGRSSGDKLDLETTTVSGNVHNSSTQLVVNHSTIDGSLTDVQRRRDSTFTSTDSTYGGATNIRMGANGTINLLGSPDGSNHFEDSVSIRGARRRDITVNQRQNSVVFDETPSYKHASVTAASPTIATPTVDALSASTTTPIITGTYDSADGPKLRVTVNGRNYTLGTDSQLTTPSTGKWSLNLTGNPLTTKTTTVTVASFNTQGDAATGTGTITSQQAIIGTYLAAQNLTATKTASGLNYVITTQGSGAIPTAGKSLSVNYSGYLLNADGTLGTKFDSNTDAQFGHVTPLVFTLGTGAVIKGWDEAFALLPVGTTAKLIIPSAIAYGTTGSGSSIPANSTLIFDVTLLSAT